ncbi:ATP-binding protein, partial [Klebsiella pneumoniae]|uniref:ATP-binding protein n=1 Tax=Klebsiella pneumoniae TaxID=573 RepID=UPI00215DA8E4
ERWIKGSAILGCVGCLVGHLFMFLVGGKTPDQSVHLNLTTTNPTLHLASLTPEELYILLRNLRHVYAGGDPENYLVPDEALTGFLHHCSKTIGDAYFRTPRNTIKGFLDMLAVLEQNRTMNWQTLIEGVAIEEDRPSDMDDTTTEESDDDDGLANFKL